MVADSPAEKGISHDESAEAIQRLGAGVVVSQQIELESRL